MRPDHEVRQAAVSDALSLADLKVLTLDQLDYRDRVTAYRGMDRIVVDIVYNGRGQVTGVEPVSYQGSIEFALQSLEAVSQLPDQILHPRFRSGGTTPAERIRQQLELLTAAGLEVTSIQLAQYETVFTVESGEGSATVATRHNRRGRTTWHQIRSETGADVGDAALTALRLQP